MNFRSDIPSTPTPHILYFYLWPYTLTIVPSTRGHRNTLQSQVLQTRINEDLAHRAAGVRSWCIEVEVQEES